MHMFKEEETTEKKSLKQQQLSYSESFTVVVFALKEILDLDFLENDEKSGEKKPKNKKGLLIKELKEQLRKEKTKKVEKQLENVKVNEKNEQIQQEPLTLTFNLTNKEIAKNELWKNKEIGREKTTFKEHEISEAYVFIIHDPETKKTEIIKEQEIIKFSTLEQKIVDESLSQKNDEKIMAYISEPVIKNDIEKFEEEVKKNIEEDKNKKQFGDATIFLTVEKNIEEKPENIKESLERKEKILKEIEKTEKTLEEMKKAVEQKNETKLREKMGKMPPIMKKRLEILLREKREKLLAFLQIELLFIKALKEKIRKMGVKSIVQNAKNILLSIASLLK